MAVALTARFFWPRFIKLMTSEVVETGTNVASGTLIPSCELLRISNVFHKSRKSKKKNRIVMQRSIRRQDKVLKKRISAGLAISGKKISDLLVVDFKHLN